MTVGHRRSMSLVKICLLNLVLIPFPCQQPPLQLVLKDGLKDAGYLNKVMGKASSIMNYARMSTLAAELIVGENRHQKATVKCWDSQPKMIRSILSIPEEKLNALETISLTKYDQNIFREMCEILSPFEEVTDYVQKQNYV